MASARAPTTCRSTHDGLRSAAHRFLEYLSTGGPNYYTDAAAAAAVAAAAESEVDHHWNGVCCSNWALSLLVFFGGFSCAF